MRIIAGSRRSLPLKTMAGEEVRPTTDRIKETLFNILQDRIYGSYFLDLYAGSGQIGLEALSRGAAYAVFVEQGKKQAEIIQENIRFTKFERESMLLQTNVSAGIFRLSGKFRFDLIFADPPYKSKVFPQLLTDLAEAKILKPEGQVILEADRREETGSFEDYGFSVVREKIYKTNKHVFLQRMEEKP